MKVGLISIGDELLIGQTINTNVTWIGEQLSLRGFQIDSALTIRDDASAIIEGLDTILDRTNFVIITGGLGPTKDDITKRVLSEYFKTELVLHQPTLDKVTAYFERSNRPMLQVNSDQALLPKNAEVLNNDLGTAPGMLFEKHGKWVFSLPGVPYEMKHIMETSVFALLEGKFKIKSSYYRTVMTQGIGESFLADRIQDIETELRNEGLELAYLPSPGYVRLRITGKNDEKGRARVLHYCDEISNRIPEYTFGMDGANLSKVVGELLMKKGEKLGCVESCTGGRIAAEIVGISGSSSYFNGGIVSYTNELKNSLVGVKKLTIETYGAVSEETVSEMALGGMKTLGVDHCIAVSGIAGPDGGTPEKPVGTVWIAIASNKGVYTNKFHFGDERLRTIERTTATALNLLRCRLSEINL
jgi:nicotinamide-nucleotide amidase